MLIISVLGIYPIPVYRGACPIVQRCGLSSDMAVPRYHQGRQVLSRLAHFPSFSFLFTSPFAARIGPVPIRLIVTPYASWWPHSLPLTCYDSMD